MNLFTSVLILASTISQALSQNKLDAVNPRDYLAVAGPLAAGGKGGGNVGQFINSYDSNMGINGLDGFPGGMFKGGAGAGVVFPGFGPSKLGPGFGGFHGIDVPHGGFGGFVPGPGPHDFGGSSGKDSGSSIASAVADIFSGNKDFGKSGTNENFDNAVQSARDIASDAGYKIKIDGAFNAIETSEKADVAMGVKKVPNIFFDPGFKLQIDGAFKVLDKASGGPDKAAGDSGKGGGGGGGGGDAVEKAAPEEFAAFKPNVAKKLMYHALFPGFKPITLDDLGKDSWFSQLKELMDKSYPKFPDLTRDGSSVFEPHPGKIYALPYGAAPLFVRSNGKGSVYVPFKLPHADQPLLVPFHRETKRLNYPDDPIYIPWVKLVVETKKGHAKYSPYIPFQPDKNRSGKEGAPLLIPVIHKEHYFANYVPYMPVIEEPAPDPAPDAGGAGKEAQTVQIIHTMPKKWIHY